MLTHAKLRLIKPQPRIKRYYDRRGLYLQVMPHGGRYWRLKYHIKMGSERIEKTLALGVYPDISLKAAREAVLEAKRQLTNGIDPSLHKRTLRLEQANARAQHFLGLAEHWFETQAPAWSNSYQTRTKRFLFTDFKTLHKLPLTELTPALIMQPLQVMLDRGTVDSAHRALQVVHQVLNHGCALGLIHYNCATPLKTTLPRPISKHFSAPTTPKDYHEVIRLIWENGTDSVVDTALKLCPLLLIRPSELRAMEWQEITDDQLWRIPAAKMKRNRDHVVPLSHQALALIHSMQSINGNRQYVFASPTHPRQSISENALLQRMRRLGITKDMGTPHGFRASARTLLDEVLAFKKDWIEHQLAHKVREPDGRAYNRTQFLRERKDMMQTWSDYTLQYVLPTPDRASNVQLLKEIS